MRTRDYLLVELNGEIRKIQHQTAGLMLSDFLRYERCLTGTKVVCAEGDCGACTVLKAPLSGAFESMNSCIAPLALVDGTSVVTVEALASTTEHGQKKLTPAQDAMVQCHASQCGFCTPGFVMALTGLVEKKLAQKAVTPISEKEAKNVFTGNLCRCTGYQPILEAACKVDLKQCSPLSKTFTKNRAALKKAVKTPVLIQHNDFTLYAPTELKQAAQYLAKNKEARLLGFCTDLGVQSNKGKIFLNHTVSLHLVEEIKKMSVIKPASNKKPSRLRVGAAVSLSELRRKVQPSVPEFARFLDIFASPQIKNVATLAGNIANASPIADTPPFLLVANTVLHIVGPKGKRKIPLETFYVGYKKTALRAGELIAAIEFDLPSKSEKLGLYKISQRKDLDISTVNGAFRANLSKDGQLQTIALALGGVAAVPLRLKKTEKFLLGKKPSGENLQKALQVLHTEITPLSDMRGTSAFRRITTENIFLRFFGERAQ